MPSLLTRWFWWRARRGCLDVRIFPLVCLAAFCSPTWVDKIGPQGVGHASHNLLWRPLPVRRQMAPHVDVCPRPKPVRRFLPCPTVRQLPRRGEAIDDRAHALAEFFHSIVPDRTGVLVAHGRRLDRACDRQDGGDMPEPKA